MHPKSKHLLAGVGLAIAYYVLGKVGLSFAYVNASASAVWPPAGLALAALLLLGRNLWPAVFAGAFLVNITTQGSWLSSLGIALGNTFEAVVAATLILRFCGGVRCFDHISGILKYALFAGGASPLISATVGVTTLALTGYAEWTSYGIVWLTWWLGDVVSILMLGPLLIIWKEKPVASWKWKRAFEFISLLILTSLVSELLFTREYPVTYLLILPILLAAFRFNQAGAISAAFIISTVALWNTVHGSGRFAQEDPNASLLFAQFFVGSITLIALAVAAVITERQDSELAVRNSAERLQLALSAGRLGDWFWEAQTDQVTLGDRASEIIGIPQGKAITWTALRELLHEEDRERARIAVEESLSLRRDYSIEYRVIQNSGALVWIAAKGRGIYSEEGGVLGMIGVVQDITEQKAAEESLQLANKAKDQFLATLSHELRTPLMPVLMTVSAMLKQENISRPMRDGLKRIEKNILTEASLIDDLLDLTRIAQNRLEFEFEKIDLHDALQRAIEFCLPEITQSGCEVLLELHSGTPLVRADRKRLQQIFWNLIKNAIKFSPGKPCLRIVSCVSAGEVHIKFEDKGVGIPPDYLELIFNPFEQADKPSSGGLGLGLAICRTAVEGFGGRIKAESAGPDQGSVFTVTLRLVQCPVNSYTFAAKDF